MDLSHRRQSNRRKNILSNVARGLALATPIQCVRVTQNTIVITLFTTDLALKMQSRSMAFNNKLNRNLLSNLSPGSRTLDVGCGYGAFTAVARDHGLDAYGIDFNAKSIEIGREAFGLDSRLQVSSVDQVKQIFRHTTFDLITMFEVIEHVEHPRELVNTVFNLLSPGGMLVLSCPNEDRWMPCGLIYVDYPPHHLTRWTPGSLKGMLVRAGFEDVSTVVDASVRDWVWTYFVNRSASRGRDAKIFGNMDESHSLGGERINWRRKLKRRLYAYSKYGFAPLDMLIRLFGIGTMGMRTVARKPLDELAREFRSMHEEAHN